MFKELEKQYYLNVCNFKQVYTPSYILYVNKACTEYVYVLLQAYVYRKCDTIILIIHVLQMYEPCNYV